MLQKVRKFANVLRRGNFKDGLSAFIYFINDNFQIYNSFSSDFDFINEYYESDPDDEEFVIIKLPGYDLRVPKSDRGISRQLTKAGLREYNSYWLYRKYLKELPKNPVIFEIGANLGYYAIAAAVDRPDATIYCAELDEYNTMMLKENVKLNNLNNIEVRNVAISDQNGNMPVIYSNRSNCHSLSSKKSDTTVKTVTGRSFLSDYGLSVQDVDVLRMDVEGHEHNIIKGMPDLCPSLVHIEFHPFEIKPNSWRDLMNSVNEWDLEIKCVNFNDKMISCENIFDLPGHGYPEVVLFR